MRSPFSALFSPDRSNDRATKTAASAIAAPGTKRPAAEDHDPRRALAWAPESLQWIITEITGKALPGQMPPFRWTPASRFALTLAVLASGMALSWLAMAMGLLGLPLLGPAWLLTVSAMRTFQTSFVHHAAHQAFLQPAWLGRLVAEALSTAIWIQPVSRYEPEHKLHHGKTATSADADLRFLIELGFRPGLTVGAYWRMFARMLASPQFHAQYARHRLLANFAPGSAPWPRRLASIAWTVALLFAAWWSGLWFALAIVWLIPAWPLYQMAGLAQLLTEHNWVRIGDGAERPKVVLGRLTHARFFGPKAPLRNMSRLAMMAQFVQLLAVSLPERLFVAPGDLPNHDWHHRHTLGDWANAAYARRDDLLAGESSWGPYTERWGFREAANATFQLLAALPQDAVLGEPQTYAERRDVMLGM